ncbi:hypothetical protein HRbin19_01234 [bacterium HR19]|nr:hypothetical protein HRbin19_01234 [bacterium HR19]
MPVSIFLQVIKTFYLQKYFLIMRPRLLKFLSCPKCKSVFQLYSKKRDKEKIIEGSLVCENCQAVYPIYRGIPRILDRENLSNEKRKIAMRFGVEWKLHKHIFELYEKQFLEMDISLQTRKFQR